MRKGIAIDQLARRPATARPALEGLGLGEVVGQSQDTEDARALLGGQVVAMIERPLARRGKHGDGPEGDGR